MFIAQTGDIIPGGGWVGAALLSGVLGWLLMKHIPAKDAQIEKMITAKDNAISTLVSDFRVETREQRAANQAALDKICQEFEKSQTLERANCEKNFAAIAERLPHQ